MGREPITPGEIRSFRALGFCEVCLRTFPENGFLFLGVFVGLFRAQSLRMGQFFGFRLSDGLCLAGLRCRSWALTTIATGVSWEMRSPDALMVFMFAVMVKRCLDYEIFGGKVPSGTRIDQSSILLACSIISLAFLDCSM